MKFGLNRHMTCAHDKIPQFKCNLCNKLYYRKESLEKHALKCKNNQTTQIECSTCNKSFETTRKSKDHTRKCHQKAASFFLNKKIL